MTRTQLNEDHAATGYQDSVNTARQASIGEGDSEVAANINSVMSVQVTGSPHMMANSHEQPKMTA